MSDDEREIRALVSRWMEAAKAGDLEAVLGLMTDDVVFLVPGRAPMRKDDFAAASRPPPGAGAARIDGKSEIQELQVEGDWAWMWTRLFVVMTPPDGSPPVERAGHTLSILRKVDGRWRIARDANLLAPVARRDREE
jgi:uncharacterized protein (TIGR02246 family)